MISVLHFLKALLEAIYLSLIERYLNMGTAQYLRDFRSSYQLKKSAELRKRVLQRQKKSQEKADSVPFKVSILFCGMAWAPVFLFALLT